MSMPSIEDGRVLPGRKGHAMRMSHRKKITGAAIGLTIGMGMSTLSAQDTAKRTIEQYGCKDVMRESGTNRDVAIAFLHGYLLGKSGGSSFDLQTLRRQTDVFIENCLDHPGD